MKKSPKIIIVGAGPVGCYTGRLLKHFGYNTLLLEEHPEVGKPVSCAGIIGRDVFLDLLLPPSMKSIVNKIDGAMVHYKRISFDLKRQNVAYIVDREKFDKELSEELQIEFNTKLQSVSKDGPGYRVETTNGDYYADILIGADGPHSKVRKDLRFDHNLKLYKGAQYRIKAEVHKKDKVIVDYVKPFSLFVWMIPEGNGIVRVGAISENPVKSLEKFRDERGISGEIIEKNSGPIPIGICQLVKNNAAVVGDAACHIKPITSGGIFYGMRSAELLVDSIKNGDLSQYEKKWNEEFGQEIKFCLLARYVSENLSEDVLEKVFSYVKKNASLMESIGNFENHSSVIWALIGNPKTYPTLAAIIAEFFKNPKILFKVLSRRL